jgi:ferredoxin
VDNKQIPFHYVCTLDRARELVDSNSRFWVSNCGCREARKQCKRSRKDICLMFSETFPGSGSGKREITRAEAEAILAEAEKTGLVTRPWRDEARTGTDGICFCCDDCCGYFLDPTEVCDKGNLLALTEMDACNNCGECVDSCYFKARRLDEKGQLQVDSDKCYGCGLCVRVCPEDCVTMTPRV